MELKQAIVTDSVQFNDVLIAPLWNWNHNTSDGLAFASSVLIAPLWNWNLEKEGKLDKAAIVLIAPLWNWNLLRRSTQIFS